MKNDTNKRLDQLVQEKIIDSEEVARQEKLGEIDFATSMELAAQILLNDRSQVETPLNILSEGSENSEEQVKKELENLIRDSGKMCLIPIEGDVKGCFPPEYGESRQDNWVYYVTISGLSDHLYWIIIPRDGAKGYCYGFN